MDPITAGASYVISCLGDASYDYLKSRGADVARRRRRLQPNENHDIARGTYQALVEATLYRCEAILRRHGLQEGYGPLTFSSRKHQRNRSVAETRGLDVSGYEAVQTWAKAELNRLDGIGNDFFETTAAFDIDPMIGFGDTPHAREQLATMAEAMRAHVKNQIAGSPGERGRAPVVPPSIFEVRAGGTDTENGSPNDVESSGLQSGAGENHVGRGKTEVFWDEYFRDSLREIYKADEAFREAATGGILTALRDGQTELAAGQEELIEMLRERTQPWGGGIPPEMRTFITEVRSDLKALRVDVVATRKAAEEGEQAARGAEKAAKRTEKTAAQSADEIRRLRNDLDSFRHEIGQRPSPRGTVAPARPDHFVGRGEKGDEVIEALTRSSLVTIFGTGGIGKSALAAHLYHQITDEEVGAPWAEGGAEYIDLSGQDTALGVIGEIARAFGFDPAPKTASDLMRCLAARGPRLYIFDDIQQAIAGDEAETFQFIDVLGSHDGGFRVLLTCRREPVVGQTVSLTAIEETAAEDLFRHVAGETGYAWTEGDDAALAELLPELGGHPLAIKLAAGLLPALGSAKELLQAWNERRTALLKTLGEKAGRLSSLDVSLDLSYAGLSRAEAPDLARGLFALMADLPGGAAPDMVRSLFGTEGIGAAETLRRRSLIYREDGRYRMLVPVRHFAASQPTGLSEAKRPEVDAFLLQVARQADEESVEDDGTWTRRMEAELPNIEEALRRASERGDDTFLANLTYAARRAFERSFGRKSSREWLATGREAARRTGDERIQGDLTFYLGEVARLQHDHGAAEDFYDDARSIYQDVGYRRGEAYATDGLGDVALHQGDPGAAEGFYNTARSIHQDVGDRLGEANATRGLGDVALHQGALTAAEDFYDTARSIYQDIGDRLGEANATKGLGDVARLQGDLSAAEDFYDDARSIYQDIGDRLGEAHATRGLGDVARLQGDLGAAEGFYNTTRSIYQDVGSRLGEANATMGLGHVALRQGDLGAAEDFYDDARSIYQDIGDRLGEANATDGLGDVALHQGDLSAAEDFYDAARSICQDIGDRLGESNATCGLGDVALRQGDLGAAEGFYDDARSIHQDVGDRLGEANATYGLGKVALRQGDLSAAKGFFDTARSIFQDIGDRLGEANATRGLGHVARRQDDLGAAESFYNAARSIYQDIGDRLGEANATYGLGNVALRQGDLSAAEDFHDDARSIYQDIGSRLGEANATDGLGDVLVQQERDEEAKDMYKRSLQLFLDLGNTQRVAHAWKDLAELSSRQKDWATAGKRYAEAAKAFKEAEDLRLGVICAQRATRAFWKSGDAERTAEWNMTSVTWRQEWSEAGGPPLNWREKIAAWAARKFT
jgi:tetratricopeptide (TPR) repeat protein